MTRARLPNRRASSFHEFDHENVHYVGSVSRFRDGRIAEVFLSGGKLNTQADILARDSAIAASLAFQHGCSSSDLRDALTRQGDGSGAGPLARFLDLIGEEGR